MLKIEKKEYLNKFTKSIKDKELILIDYEGITVKNISNVREKLRQSNSIMTVVKNSLIKLAFEKQGIEMDISLFKGMSALITVGDAFYEAGKVLLEAEKGELLKIKGGYFEGQVVDEDYVKKLANIPSKEALYSMLVGCLQSPVANLVYTLESISELKAKEPLVDEKPTSTEESLDKNRIEEEKMNSNKKEKKSTESNSSEVFAE